MKIPEVVRNWLTARDNLTFSVTKILGLVAGISLIAKFWMVDAPSFMDFATGIAAIMAALAAKYYVEKEN